MTDSNQVHSTASFVASEETLAETIARRRRAPVSGGAATDTSAFTRSRGRSHPPVDHPRQGGFLIMCSVSSCGGSGNGYRYGTVGSKPRLLECTPGVVKTGRHSDVYRWSGVNWVKVAGTFNSYGTGNMQQLSVQYVCANATYRYFEVVTTGWGTNSRGQTGVGRDSTGSYRLQCG